MWKGAGKHARKTPILAPRVLGSLRCSLVSCQVLVLLWRLSGHLLLVVMQTMSEALALSKHERVIEFAADALRGDFTFMSEVTRLMMRRRPLERAELGKGMRSENFTCQSPEVHQLLSKTSIH